MRDNQDIPPLMRNAQLRQEMQFALQMIDVLTEELSPDSPNFERDASARRALTSAMEDHWAEVHRCIREIRRLLEPMSPDTPEAKPTTDSQTFKHADVISLLGHRNTRKQ